ncbi:unnamed protein product [Protopolystoma xenopodis]|uniref:Uncharacterized protein n=1 Tax=Protopolystoma xenopodis TaxID=117903 RepID=A0A448XMH5_9PLAT|nr:unnamed protein product [Protopolystoma xenopodis]
MARLFSDSVQPPSLSTRPVICQSDEVGEICLAAEYTGTGYWGLRGQTGAHFHVEPLLPDGSLAAPGRGGFTRSGLIGFRGPVSSVCFHESIT